MRQSVQTTRVEVTERKHPGARDLVGVLPARAAVLPVAVFVALGPVRRALQQEVGGDALGQLDLSDNRITDPENPVRSFLGSSLCRFGDFQQDRRGMSPVPW